MPVYDDAAKGIRRLLGKGDDVARGAKVTATLDPSIVRYLDELNASGAMRAADDLPAGVYRAPEIPDAPGPADLSLGSPAWHDLDKSARAYDNIAKGRIGNLRNQDRGLVDVARRGIQDAAANAAAPPPGLMRQALPAAGVAGLAGVYAMTDGPNAPPAAKAAPKTPDMDSTDGTAELANEARPAPEVMPEEERAFSDKFKRQYTAEVDARHQAGFYGPDYREQAHQMIAQLNQMRRAAGGEVPQAQQMKAQIADLLSKADSQSNARTTDQRRAVRNASPSDPHAQASYLIGQLNDMRRKAGGEVPQAQQMMAEIRRLQALGDQQRNSRR